jgi:Xaa-Pro aminopeptidase
MRTTKAPEVDRVPTFRAASGSDESTGDELPAKVALLRDTIERHRLGGIRLRGQDWFAWATCGGSSAVLLASEHGIADVLATPAGVQVLTSTIEANRLRAEELPEPIEVVPFAWQSPQAVDRFVREAAHALPIASDLPRDGEVALPDSLVAEKRRLVPSEIARYRELGRASATAMTETLGRVTPTTTELEVAGLGAEALWRRGIEPALVLVAGSRRIDRHRHPRPTAQPIGDHVMVVFCGRRHGLYANLTRTAYFRSPSAEERAAARVVAAVEAAALDASVPGATLGAVYAEIVAAYARLGHAGAERDHHQGGTTGYLSREALAMPNSALEIVPPVALAWNPSLPGSKIEDTILLTDEGLDVLTVDPVWPTSDIDGRARPDPLIRG